MARRRTTLEQARAQADALASGKFTPAPKEPKPRAAPQHWEDAEQKAYFQWVEIQLQRDERYKNIYAVPNGGTRIQKENKNGVRYSPEAQRMREQGVRKGVLDINVDWPVFFTIEEFNRQVYRWRYHGLRLEMKRQWKKGEPRPPHSPEQAEWRDRYRRAGYCVCLCYGAEQAIAATLAYFAGQPVPHEWSPT